MSTITAHPALRGRADHEILTRRRRLAVPGEATGTFWLMAAVVTVLNMIGLVMVLSASSVESVRTSGSPWSYAERQVAGTVIGLVALSLTLAVSVSFWRRFVKPGMIVSIALLVLVLVPGIGLSENGARRWIGAGPAQFQPSEFAKFALLLFVADLLARRSRDIDDWRWTLVPAVTYLLLVTGLIMLEPNLGTSIIVAATILAVLLASGIRLVPLALTTLGGVAVATAFVFGTPFRRDRFFRFLDPMGDRSGTGLQNVQSLVAMANGGLFGRGLGRSTVKWGYLPYAWTDFIYAVIGEEFGLVGALVVVGLFLTLAILGIHTAARARSRFEMLVAVGITAWISVQALMNIGAVISLMPITGVPLPFVSFGSSALVINMAAIGMLMNIARHPRGIDASDRAIIDLR